MKAQWCDAAAYERLLFAQRNGVDEETCTRIVIGMNACNVLTTLVSVGLMDKATLLSFLRRSNSPSPRLGCSIRSACTLLPDQLAIM